MVFTKYCFQHCFYSPISPVSASPLKAVSNIPLCIFPQNVQNSLMFLAKAPPCLAADQDPALHQPQLDSSSWRKKKGHGLCPCTDYRGLNQISVRHPYPIPLVPSAHTQFYLYTYSQNWNCKVPKTSYTYTKGMNGRWYSAQYPGIEEESRFCLKTSECCRNWYLSADKESSTNFLSTSSYSPN